MITAEQIYAATDRGLDIIASHFPKARESASTGRPFRMRDGERTPSAYVKLFGKGGDAVWKVTDFGGDGVALSPIDLHMRETGLRFYEAVLDLAMRYGVSDTLRRDVNRPDIRKTPAEADDKEGDCRWEIVDEFTDSECRIMGPCVKADTLRALHWYRVKWIYHVKNRERVYKYPNDNYPIFMRECWYTGADGKQDRFYKIYEPLNYDKGFRFSYQPKGKKPKDYINGYEELRRAFNDLNEKAEAEWTRDPANEGKPYKEQKLEAAIICSGERDSLCARAAGYHPIWFNSETYRATAADIRKISRMVETVYNIPDIDETGRRKGAELALEHIDVHTVWLPDWLREYRDNRGKGRKDLRDYVELRQSQSDFDALLTLATPARFWYTRTDKAGQVTYKIDVECLHRFLNLNGFYALKTDSETSTRLIRIDGNVVHKVTSKDIRAFVRWWTEDTAQPRALRNLVLTTPLLSEASLEAIKEIDLDFTNCTASSQWFYFPGFSLEVTGKEIRKHDNKGASVERYVWDKDVIDHPIKILPDMFEITRKDGGTRSEDFGIRILDTESKYFRYLINSSRVHWRKELEYNLEWMPRDKREEYRKAHRWDIAGEGLTDDEVAEQVQCLMSKIFCIGYMMHRFKSPSRPWAPYIMDALIGDRGASNGGSGKSFMFIALGNFMKWIKISGKNKNVLDNPHCFEQIDKYTAMCLVDDLCEYFPIKDFYDLVSAGITVNAKYENAYTLKYKETPKWVFTTNFVPKDFAPSTVRRSLYLVAGDYYHQRTEDNDYLETRTIKDDFGKDLFDDDYTDREWEADINFILQCVRFYLSVADENVKIESRLTNIIYRKYLNDMSENFREWAGYYFAPEGGNLDREIVREDAFNDYQRFTGVRKVTMHKFTRSLKGFCFTCPYVAELNPADKCNASGRILRRIENTYTHVSETKEMIYLRSVDEKQRIDAITAASAAGAATPREDPPEYDEPSLPFAP